MGLMITGVCVRVRLEWNWCRVGKYSCSLLSVRVVYKFKAPLEGLPWWRSG